MISLGQRVAGLLILALLVFPASANALPRRLVLFLDGVAYRDVCALQRGVTGPDGKFRYCFQAFYPASRVISTYPSASDAASTDIFGNRPLPGYQRTYYSHAANATMSINALTSAVEFERQMDWLLPRGWPYAKSFVAPVKSFLWEVPRVVQGFLSATNNQRTYYAYVISSDNVQHMSRDILALLCSLDESLTNLRKTYREREGRDLEVLIFSDHGNNHTRSERIQVRPFLRGAAYHISTSIQGPKDVVLPTAGIESWVEIHNAPSETEALLTILTRLKGVEILTARDPVKWNRFIVVDPSGQRAAIDWKPAEDLYRYRPQMGDPLRYIPVIEVLKRKHLLDQEGFGKADDWMKATFDHYYPVALERIARGHSRTTLNPASIILGLDDHYVHAAFWIKIGSGLVNCGGTHGGLNALDSTGVLLSSFAPTSDTTTHRLARTYGGFADIADYRSRETGAELISPEAQGLVGIPRVSLDRNCISLDTNTLYLRVWSPALQKGRADAPVNVSIRPAKDIRPIAIRRSDPQVPIEEQELMLARPLNLPEVCYYERIYALPEIPGLEPGKAYLLSGRLGQKTGDAFKFEFRTDAQARPVAY